MTRYVYGTIEGEAPDDMSPVEVREELHATLPDWAEVQIRRVGAPERDSL